MPRDKETGKPKGFAFVMYEDQNSTVLAVDNMNGGQVLGRTIRVSLRTFLPSSRLLLNESRSSRLVIVADEWKNRAIANPSQVDHCRSYKQSGTKDADGKYQEPEEPTYNAMPPTLSGTCTFLHLPFLPIYIFASWANRRASTKRITSHFLLYIAITVNLI